LKLRPIAIYLPQFHPIPENDEWWGKGFTEWTNVVKAKPLFDGHYQPQLPADLGFYDLRLNETLVEQAKLAQQYGLSGFCYYHYWFNGKLLLEKPIQDMLESKKPDFPFMLCWANENWTRTWDGLDREVLMRQNYNDQDDLDHIKFMIPYFKDRRYIRVNNKPVFIVYKPFLMPDPTATVKRWRDAARKHGIELYLCHMIFSYHKDKSLIPGFDAMIDFEPFGTRHETNVSTVNGRSFVNKVTGKLSYMYWDYFVRNRKEEALHIVDYGSYARTTRSLVGHNEKIFPSLVPGWDNSPRRAKNPTLIMKNSTPATFEEWLRFIVSDFKPFSEDENFIFINAWNEWAEGNHLEPCRKWGNRYLDAVKSVFND
jgi:lipopolysaccharide biosynthesis protein